MPDLLSVAIGSVLGAAFGVGTRVFEQVREHRRKRAALSTALLVELHSLDGTLRILAETKRPSRSVSGLNSEFFRKARTGDLPDLLLFSPQCVYEVMKFAGLVNRVVRARERAQKVESPTEKHEYDIHLQSRFALNAVAATKNALLAEGAIEPKLPKGKMYYYPELPDVPPEQFRFVTGDDSAERAGNATAGHSVAVTSDSGVPEQAG